MTTKRNPDLPNPSGNAAIGRLLAALVVLALISTACGRFTGDSSDTSTQAQVSVNGVESGCAEAIGLSILMTGAPQPSITIEDMRRFSGGASAIEPMFEESAEATEYAGVVAEIAAAAADAAEARESANAEQILLLVEVEKVGRRADLDRLTPAADTFFAQTCGSEYRTAADIAAQDSAALAAAATVQATQESASSSVDDTAAAVAESVPGETTTSEAEPAGPEPVLTVDDSSVGATGTYLSVDFEIGEIWRTNLTPQAAIEGGTELGEEEIVMVGIKITSPGERAYTRPAEFGLTTDADGRTNADAAVSATGAEWNTQVDGNETRRGFLIFPSRVGDLTDGTFQIGGNDDDEVESIPLGQAAASSPYPVTIASGQTGAGQLSNDDADCRFDIESEIRSAAVTLDAQDNVSIVRAGRNERFVTLDVAMKLNTLGSGCGPTLYMNLTDIRLQLDNGDVIGPIYSTGQISEGASAVVPMSFPVPKGVTTAELIDETGAPFASWTDLALPDA